MALGTSVQSTIRNLIDKTSFISSSATLYSFSSATKALDDEGVYTVSNWGSGTSVRVIPEENKLFEQMEDSQGFERVGQITVLIKDNVTVAEQDRLTLNTINYRVGSVERVAELDNSIIVQRLVCDRE